MLSRKEIIDSYDPSGVGLENGNFCGLPFDYDTSGIILLGIPWEVTVSYHAGTADGPTAVLQASPQLDLYDLDNPDAWRQGIFMPPIPDWIRQQNDALRPLATQIVQATEKGVDIAENAELSTTLATVNEACQVVNQWLYEEAKAAIASGKRVGAIGGDHSAPLGLIQALAEEYPDFGILHIDAHA
ncbi:MAG: arginase family protein, partial [Cyanobacteria bacterium J06636_16]